MIEDGGIVVLGGLISDNASRGESRVPFLGRIPLIGLAFKTRNSDRLKTNLMIFIRPKILRDGVQAAYETDAKYNYIVDEQKKTDKRELIPLLPGRGPKLPPMPPAPTGEDATDTDPRVQQEIERRKRLKEEAQKESQSQSAQPQGAPAPQATPAPTPPPADSPPQGEQTPPKQ
jgi:Flp pilus assembly secretin CpaC